MVSKYEVIHYFDVWGNEEDGYTVNDQTVIGVIEIDNNDTDDEIVEKLTGVNLRGRG